MAVYPNRITSVKPSATVEISDLAEDLQSRGWDVIDLSAGDPDFSTPEHIRERTKVSLDEGQTHYTPSNGIPKLREVIATKLQKENDVSITADEIIVTPGAKQGLFEALFALLQKGDEVVLLDPAWVSYEALVRMCGGSISRVLLDPDAGFTLGDVDLAETVTDDTRAIIINTPSNPTGTVFSRDDLNTIRDLAIDHDVWVFADEIYEKLRYGAEHISIASMDKMAKRTVTINGFSKSHAMTGWRLGYYTAPDDLLNQAKKVQSHTVTCATSFAQYGAVAALNGSQQPVEEMRETFEHRRNAAVDQLREEGVEIAHPDGAFYLFVPVTTDNDVALCESLLKDEGVAVTPGSAFGVSGYVRMSYANTEERVLESIDRIANHLG